MIAPMELHFPDLRYECLTCGKGCRAGWRIPIEADVLPGIEASAAAAAVTREGYVPVERVGERIVLGHKASGSCVFLRPDQLCEVHAEAGLEAKPLQCQQFPFIPVNTPDGVFVGLSFLCSAVQRGHGKPVHEHRAQVESLVERLAAKIGGLRPDELRERPADIVLAQGRTIDWPTYLALEGQVQTALRGDPYRGLWEACRALLPPRDDQMAGDMILMFMANLIGLAEAGSPPERQAICQAVLNEVPFYSARLGREVQPPPVDSPHCSHLQGCHSMPDWLLDGIRRYLSHLVFRKFLIQGASVLSQALTLLVLIPLLDWYVRLAASGPDDLYFALDTAEGELITHADGVRPVFAFFEAALSQ